MKTEAEAKEAGGEVSVIEVETDEDTVREADEEHLGHRTQMNDEAGSIVLHVRYDMDEKELTDIVSGTVRHEEETVMEYKREEASEAAAAKKNTRIR